MIEPKHNSLARFIFNAYEYRILKKSFNRFILLNNDLQIDENKPAILLPNHFSWWDGFFIDFLVRIGGIDKKFHIVMLEEQLRRYWFFRLLGASGFNPQNPKSIVKLSNYINNLLNSPHNLLVFYPQGEIQLFDNDLELKEGLSFILKNVNKDVAIYYPFFKIQYFDKRTPDLLCKLYPGVKIEIILNDFTKFIEDYKLKYEDFKQKSLISTYKRDLFTLEK